MYLSQLKRLKSGHYFCTTFQCGSIVLPAAFPHPRSDARGRPLRYSKGKSYKENIWNVNVHPAKRCLAPYRSPPGAIDGRRLHAGPTRK